MQIKLVFSVFLLTPSLLIFEISNIGRRGSVCSQRVTLSGLNGRESDSPLPSWGGEYFRFLLQRSDFIPLSELAPALLICTGQCMAGI